MQAEYNDAVRQGHTAVQLQQAVPGTSLYRVDLGNLAAREQATITLSYVRLLSSVAGVVEFDHQATWVPPYSSAEARATGTATNAGASPAYTAMVTYELGYTVTIHSARGFVSVEPSRAVATTDLGPHTRSVCLNQFGELWRRTSGGLHQHGHGGSSAVDRGS